MRPSLSARASFGSLHRFIVPVTRTRAGDRHVQGTSRKPDHRNVTAGRRTRHLHRRSWQHAGCCRISPASWRPCQPPASAGPPVQDVIVRIEERERTRLLDSRLREHRRCEHKRQNGCCAEDIDSGHSPADEARLRSCGSQSGSARETMRSAMWPLLTAVPVLATGSASPDLLVAAILAGLSLFIASDHQPVARGIQSGCSSARACGC
jgi:hypothetical protein